MSCERGSGGSLSAERTEPESSGTLTAVAISRGRGAEGCWEHPQGICLWHMPQNGKKALRVTARVFRNGRNQAIRIPVDLSFDTEAVVIEQHGDALIVRPLYKSGWDQFFADSTLVLPPEFDTGEDPPPPERPSL